MERQYPHLCKPLTLGKITLRNRICSAPLGATDITPDGSLGPRSLGFYEARALGGAATVTVSELVVHPETDGSQMLHLSLANPGQLASFTYVADAIKRHGAVASIELSHSGQYAGTYMIDRNKKSALGQYGPSETVRPDGLPVKALTQEQIASIVAAYGQTAGLAKRAGFEMVMIHAGHGWLLNQFLSPYFNRRTDKYGGSLDNRIRLTREVLTAVREAVGPGFPIELRISGSELFEGGYDIEGGCQIAQALEDLVDLIHVSAGSYQFGFSITHPSMFRDHGCNVYLAAQIKQHVSVPVATVGGLSDPQQMEDIVASGAADIVVMGRALLADPEIPNKIMANRGEDVIKCLRCFTCMAERPITQTRRCAINPRIGREIEGLRTTLAPARRKVLVAGGGIAGLVAASTAAERGHAVILAEKTGELGGILRTEAAIPFKREMYDLGLSYAHKCRRLGVDIRLNTKVDAAYIEKEGADALIVALGSMPIKPDLLGIDGDNVISVDSLYLDNLTAEKVGDSVVVLGGGLTGCECALFLKQGGRNASVVEMRDELAPDANIRQRPILLKELEAYGVDTHLGLRGVRISEEGLVTVDASGNELLIPGATVVYAIGQRALSEESLALLDAAPWVRRIGDCVRPANITTAIYEAFWAAQDI
jgi:2,4-dienoyl-CoA reductase-like NADH-dependent reductase (Old Yellow Enzyme family)/thioredoxin reductase